MLSHIWCFLSPWGNIPTRFHHPSKYSKESNFWFLLFGSVYNTHRGLGGIHEAAEVGKEAEMVSGTGSEPTASTRICPVTHTQGAVPAEF